MSLIDPGLAAVLVCTVDKSDLVEDLETRHLVCTECGRRYPVSNDGIADMVVEAAEGAGDD